MLTVAISPDALAELIEQVATSVAAKLLADCHGLGFANLGQPVLHERLALSPDEAAAAISISPRLLFDLTKSGQIRATKCGSRVIYARSELLRFLEAAGQQLGGNC